MLLVTVHKHFMLTEVEAEMTYYNDKNLTSILGHSAETQVDGGFRVHGGQRQRNPRQI
jgi:hypothetical protein